MNLKILSRIVYSFNCLFIAVELSYWVFRMHLISFLAFTVLFILFIIHCKNLITQIVLNSFLRYGCYNGWNNCISIYSREYSPKNDEWCHWKKAFAVRKTRNFNKFIKFEFWIKKGKIFLDFSTNFEFRTRPRITNETIDRGYLRSLKLGTFGNEYEKFLADLNTEPDARPSVKVCMPLFIFFQNLESLILIFLLILVIFVFLP